MLNQVVFYHNQSNMQTAHKSTTFIRIRELVMKIPPGYVSTYGNVAQAAHVLAPRVVGWALRGNQNRTVPCHRVVFKDGHLAPKFSLGGWQEQHRRLVPEKVRFLKADLVDMSKSFWDLTK